MSELVFCVVENNKFTLVFPVGKEVIEVAAVGSDEMGIDGRTAGEVWTFISAYT